MDDPDKRGPGRPPSPLRLVAREIAANTTVPPMPDDDIELDQAEEKALGRWQPGQSGNPAGRAPSVRCLTTAMREQIDQVCEYDVPLARKEGRAARTWRDVIVLGVFKEAAKGNIAAMKEILNRVDGPVASRTNVSLEGQVQHTGEVKHKFDASREMQSFISKLDDIRKASQRTVDAEIVSEQLPSGDPS